MLWGNQTEKKNTFSISYNDTQLTFSGDFDSGNLNWVGVNQETNEIEVQFGRDKDVQGNAKCWFHFSISGKYTYLPIKLHLLKAKSYDLYRPVVKVEGGDWNRHQNPIEFQIGAENQVSFHMALQLYGGRRFYIASSYPWSFTDNIQYLNQLESSLKKRKDIYFNKETLIMSSENRPLHLIAISSGEVEKNEPEPYIEHLFPNRDQESHLKMIKKPMILITSRVHPGEIGSSYSLLGMIEYLVSGSKDSRKILDQFYFLIVPILNPDGVFRGNNRMDAFGQNLNRFYLFPELERQPSCYAIKSLLENNRTELFAFFDLHGHSNKKSCYLYGNSINSERLQVESVLFAKYLSTICQHIEFKSCNFSKKQMSSKDKNEDESKEGCARVVVHKWTNSPYCYTLETGLYKNVKIDEKGIQRYGEEFYEPKTYADVGAKMIISLFAILKKDKKIEEMRKEVVQYTSKMQRLGAKKELKQMPRSKKEGNAKTMIAKKEVQKKETCSTTLIGKEQTSMKQVPVIKKMQSQKENEKRKGRNKCIEDILNRNKRYLMSLEDEK